MSDKPENMKPDPYKLPEESDELDLTEEPEQIWPPPAGPTDEVGEVNQKRDSAVPDAGWTQEVRRIDDAIDEIRRINDQIPEPVPSSGLSDREEDIELDIDELDREVGALAGAGQRLEETPSAAESKPPAAPEAASPDESSMPSAELPEEPLSLTAQQETPEEAEMDAAAMEPTEPAAEPTSALEHEPVAQAVGAATSQPGSETVGRMVAGVVESPRKPSTGPAGRVVQATCTVQDNAEDELAQLWGNIFFSADRRAPRAIIVASAQRQDGATQIAVALAMTGAEAGRDRRVALVDFNLRNPAVADVLGIAGEPGVTDILDGRSSVEAAMHVLTLKNGNELHVLPSGMQVDRPLGLLKSRQVQSLIGQLQGRYDQTIIDVSAANAQPDAQVLGSLVDGALLVVRAGFTPRETVAQAKRRLELAGVKCLGVVLNQQTHPVPGFVYRRT